MRGVLARVSLLALVVGCAPAAALFSAPVFTFIPEGSGLVRLEPPGIGSSEAAFLFHLDAQNPNPFALRIARLEFDAAVNGRHLASGELRSAVALAPGGSERLELEVRVPLARAGELLGEIARVVQGERVRYRLAGAVSVDVLGTRHRLPRATLAEGDVVQVIPIGIPQVHFDAGASGVRVLGVNRAVVEIGFELVNEGLLGYVFEVPEMALTVGGTRIATAAGVSETLLPGSRSHARVVAEVDLQAVAPLVAARFAGLTAGEPLEFALIGRPRVAVPGIATREFPRDQFLSGLLR